MKQLIRCLSLFLLVSCKTNFPTIQPQERCFVVLETQLDQGLPELLDESPKMYSGHCRCHMYEWTASHIGRITDSVNHDLSYCDKMGGFNPDSTGAIYNWQESIRLWLNRQSKN